MQDDWASRWLADKEYLMKKPVSDFLTSDDLREMDIACGSGCLVHKTVLMYGRDNIKLGSNVRIDAYTVLSAGDGSIFIDSYTHISTHVLIIGGANVNIGRFCAVGAGSKLYSMSDSFKDAHLIGPMVPEETRKVLKGPILMDDFSGLGANCIVMPNTTLEEGALGHAGTLFNNKSYHEWAEYHDVPAIMIRSRSKEFLKQALLKNLVEGQ